MWSLVHVWMIPLDWESRAGRRRTGWNESTSTAKMKRFSFSPQIFIFLPKIHMGADTKMGEKGDNGSTQQRSEISKNNLMQDVFWHLIHSALKRNGRPKPFVYVRKTCREHVAPLVQDRVATWEMGPLVYLCYTWTQDGGGCGWIVDEMDKRGTLLPACQLAGWAATAAILRRDWTTFGHSRRVC